MLDLKYIEYMQKTEEFQRDMDAYNKEFPPMTPFEEEYLTKVKLSVHSKTSTKRANE